MAGVESESHPLLPRPGVHTSSPHETHHDETTAACDVQHLVHATLPAGGFDGRGVVWTDSITKALPLKVRCVLHVSCCVMSNSLGRVAAAWLRHCGHGPNDRGTPSSRGIPAVRHNCKELCVYCCAYVALSVRSFCCLALSWLRALRVCTVPVLVLLVTAYAWSGLGAALRCGCDATTNGLSGHTPSTTHKSL